MTILEAAAALRARKVSSLEFVNDSLARIARSQLKLNAFITSAKVGSVGRRRSSSGPEVIGHHPFHRSEVRSPVDCAAAHHRSNGRCANQRPKLPCSSARSSGVSS